MMFIVKQRPNNEEELKKESRYSNIWINSTLLGCEYSDKLTNIINKKSINI